MAKRARTIAKRAASPANDRDQPADDEDVLDRICNTLAMAISGGALKPGTKILDDVIADHFGVSRTVVRGAIDILRRDHLVERKRNHGAFVAVPSIAEARQLFEARHALERGILALVVERASDDRLDQLEKLNEEEAKLPEALSNGGKPGHARQFHIELAKLGGNDLLTEVLVKVLARVALVNAVYEAEPRDNCGDHRNIVAALRRRDLAAAQKQMDSHLIDLEGRVQLTPTEGDHESFVNVIETFSTR
jgi:DNA-binding GntR family transcriptional regulator